jgi:hypothetical protein
MAKRLFIVLSMQVHSLFGVIVDKRDLAILPCFCRCEALREPLRGRVVLVVYMCQN